MSRHDNRGFFSPGKLKKHLYDRVSRFLIQISGGLIGQNKTWSVDKRPPQAQLLLFTSRQPPGKVSTFPLQLQKPQHFSGHLYGFASPHFQYLKWDNQVLQDRPLRHKPQILENHSQVLA